MSATARLSPCRAIGSFGRPCPNGWVPFTRVHLGQRAGRPAQGRSHNTQHQTRQKRRTTDAGPRTTAPRKTSIPTTTEQFQLLGRRPHGRLLLFRDLAVSQGTRLMAVSWRPDQLDPPRPIPAPVRRANRHQAVQPSRRRKRTRDRADAWRGKIGGNHGAHSRMRRARGQPGPRRVDDCDRDAGAHGGEPEQGVRPRLVGGDRLLQARQEAPGFEGVRGRLHRVESCRK